MAKKTFQQINFVTGVVDGTLAYDFDVPGYYPEEETVVVPKPRRGARRAREQEWVREESRGAERAHRAGAISKLGLVVNAAAAVGTVAAVALLLMVLMAKIQLIGISSQALACEQKISELETKNGRLTVQYEEIFNLKDIEETAVNDLGMQEPREDQIYYLTGVSSADKAVVISRQDADMFSLGVEDIIGSARDYLDTLTG